MRKRMMALALCLVGCASSSESCVEPAGSTLTREEACSRVENVWWPTEARLSCGDEYVCPYDTGQAFDVVVDCMMAVDASSSCDELSVVLADCAMCAAR